MAIISVTLSALVLAFLIRTLDVSLIVPQVNTGQIIFSVSTVSLLALFAHKRQALTPSAIATACLISLPIFLASFEVAIALAIFFLAADYATKFRSDRKAGTCVKSQAPTPRIASQVIANGLAPALFCTLALLQPDKEHALLIAAKAAIGSACADTLASEITPVFCDKLPKNILKPWQEVPIGANGGVTEDGLMISFLGGCLPCILFYLSGVVPNVEFLLQGVAATLGSLMDSVLGAGLEAPGKLDNDDVNLIANLFGGCVALYVAPYITNFA
eukprot:Blabericola_migrator_1__2445@NODE_168_length_12126_cov_91_620864_g146_i0_p6_GENE_NODE_168_length_12126_cov_91_620864_g146_i0NODE_168_length_12126_cov_91_620864_g146_i0_p6_ORF_typecomplete_len273_score41_02DUF92/PF01940_16/4_3e40TMEM234/PF10639_9/0_26_NODE_168_length_12126_cov_91_620864_g146_i01110411922